MQLGLLGSSFAITYGICGVFAGAIVDRVRRVSAVLWGLYTWSIICTATAISRTFPQLLAFRAAEGLGETVYYPASMSLIGAYHGHETRSRAMGLHQTSVYVGTIAGGFFAGLIGQHYGWRWSFIVFGGGGDPAGLGAAPLSEGAARRPRSRDARMPLLRDLRAAAAHADGALSAGRVPVREFRRRRAALLDAEVSLRQVPHDAGDGRTHGHDLRATGESARGAAGRLAGRHAAPPHPARTADRAGDRRFCGRAVRGAVRPDRFGRAADDGADVLGTWRKACTTRTSSRRSTT